MIIHVMILAMEGSLDLSTHWPLFKQNLKALGRIGGLDRQRAAGKGLSG